MDPIFGEQTIEKLGHDKLTALIYGDPGTGKTTLAGSICQDERISKVLYVYTHGDRGWESLRDGPGAEKLVLRAIEAPQELMDIQRALVQGNHDFDAVIVESLTFVNAMFNRWGRKATGQEAMSVEKIKAAVQDKGGMGPIWQANAEYMKELVVFLYSLAASENQHPIHVIITCHSMWRDQEGKQAQFLPAVQPAAVQVTLGTPNFVWFTQIEHPRSSAVKKEEESGPIYTVRLKPTPEIYAKVHGAIAKTSKIPEVLGGRGEIVTLPDIASKLNITL